MSVIPAPCPKHYTVTTSVTQEDGGDSVLLDTIGIENTSTGERYALIIIKPDAGYTVGLPNFSIGGGTPSLTSTFSTALSAGIMHFEPGVGGVTQAMMPNFSKIWGLVICSQVQRIIVVGYLLIVTSIVIL